MNKHKKVPLTKNNSRPQGKANNRSAKRLPLRAKVRHHAKVVLVPHKGNDYLPHLIRGQGLVAVLIIALLAQVTYGYMTTGKWSVLGRVSSIQTAELLADTNKERENAGLPSLILNDQLSQAAFLKAQDMVTEQYWAHVSPSGVQPWKWFGDVGYNYSYAGENLAKNYPNADATVKAWMGSATHRDNILKKEYVDVGFAVVDGTIEGKDTTVVVALYAAPVTVAAVQAASTEAPTPSPKTAQQPVFLAPNVGETTSNNPITYFGSILTALSPVTIGILGLLAVVAVVGALTYHYRYNLPKTWRKSWRVHHGLYTFMGTLVLGVLIIIATGGGSI